MAIFKGNDKIGSIYKGNTKINKIYKGVILIYEAFKKLLVSGIPPLKLTNCVGTETLLPGDYQEVEYIQNEGNQYINTGIDTSETLSFEVKAQLIHADNTSQTVWGGRQSSTANQLQSNQLSFVKSSGTYQFVCGNTAVSNKAWDIDLHVFYARKNTLYVDGEALYYAPSVQITSKNNIYLFATNTAGTAGFNGGSLKMYYCKIWDGDILVRHFIPCYRKEDKVAGMYDLVENKFYENLGDGSFIKGEDVGVFLVDYKIKGNSVQEEIPTPEKPIEIESVGEYDEIIGKYKIPVEIRGKNLFNKNEYSYTTGYYNDDGVYSTSSTGLTAYTNNYSKVKPNTTYHISTLGGYGGLKVAVYFYDIDKNWISRKSLDVNNTTLKNGHSFETPSSCDYVRFQIYLGEGGSAVPFDVNTFQLELGNALTTYEEYSKPITTNIYLDEPLRKIGNYADYIDFENQKVVRKIAKKLFDGTERVDSLSSGANNYSFFSLGENGLVTDDICLCTHLEHQPNFSFQVEGNNKFRVFNSPSNNSSRIAFRFYINNAIVWQVAEVKALLTEFYNAGTPMIVYYGHAEGLETEETIVLPNISTIKGTTIIEVDTNIQPSNMEVIYKGK